MNTERQTHRRQADRQTERQTDKSEILTGFQRSVQPYRYPNPSTGLILELLRPALPPNTQPTVFCGAVIYLDLNETYVCIKMFIKRLLKLYKSAVQLTISLIWSHTICHDILCQML